MQRANLFCGKTQRTARSKHVLSFWKINIKFILTKRLEKNQDIILTV